MKLLKLLYLVVGLSIASTGWSATELPDMAAFLRAQGWRPYYLPPVVLRSHAAIAPVLFYDKGHSVPSCGVVVQQPKKPSHFIELVGSEEGADFPQCLAMPAVVPFKLDSVDHVSVEVIVRDPRDETYREFHYLRQDGENGYLLDSRLTDAVPNAPSDVAAVTAPAGKQFDGVRLARAAHIAARHATWRMLDSHFISTPAASFAILDNPKTGECLFVGETGAAPLAVRHTEAAPGSKCMGVLASSKLETPKGLVFIGMFKAPANRNLVAVMLARPDGTLVVEKALAHSLNASGATANMKVAKAALLAAMR